ncbi:MAG: 23S rRNA (pseudouridine(1915)-N(3))-methyltransferase RlmH [Myxococcota bacterium]
MKIQIVVVGKDRGDPLVEAADEYVERLKRAFPATVVEVREEPATRQNPLDRVRSVEAERIQKALADGAYLVALDEGGVEHRSTEIADRLKKLQLEARPVVSFVIGGPNGLDPALLKSAKERWSLSRLTLPHRLARLVLAEQLYRASTILRGEPYHR